MEMPAQGRQRTRQREREAEAREFRIALRIGFAVFLVFALVSRLLPRSQRPAPFSDAHPRSVLAEARAAAHTIVPFAYMR